MAIQTNKVVVHKVLPLVIFTNLQAQVTVRTGYIDDSQEFIELTKKDVLLTDTQVMSILSAPPVGTTRYDDLSDALYKELLDMGEVAGELV